MVLNISLIFTICLWLFALLIFISGRKNRVNQWCAAAILIFSIGTFKEYFFFSLAPVLMEKYSWFTRSISENFYSVLTALLYYTAMPAAFYFAMYFCDFNRTHTVLFRRAGRIIPVGVILLMLIFPPFMTRKLQLSSEAYWITVMLYNLSYGVGMTILMLRTLLLEHHPVLRRQKRLVSLITLPPVWYWLIAIFVIHALRLRQYFKLWQGNSILIVLVLFFYICMAFREGIMGLKLNGINYQWDSDRDLISRSTQYTNHMLKNELYKITWCVENLEKQFSPDIPEEVGIISRSAVHLKEFVEKTRLYSNDISMEIRQCRVKELIETSLEGLKKSMDGIDIEVDCPEDAVIGCDATYVGEVISNLLLNGLEALPKGKGHIGVRFRPAGKRRYHILSVEDNGCGMTREQQSAAFAPYHTGKSGGNHFGLGLFFCYHVMMKHNGYIDVNSTPGKGSTFSLYFPRGKK